MRKLFTLLCIGVLTSCSALKLPEVALGMSEAEFKEQFHNKWLVELYEDVAVYRVSYVDETQYYHFKSGKLVRLETVEKRPNLIIEHTRKTEPSVH